MDAGRCIKRKSFVFVFVFLVAYASVRMLKTHDIVHEDVSVTFCYRALPIAVEHRSCATS